MKTIEENNRMIAEFMEYPGDGKGKYFFDISETLVSADNLSYHTSWEWLMEVVEKIASEYHKTEIVSDEESDYCKITVYVNTEYSCEILECGLSTKEATYKAVCRFIEWYNENK